MSSIITTDNISFTNIYISNNDIIFISNNIIFNNITANIIINNDIDINIIDINFNINIVININIIGNNIYINIINSNNIGSNIISKNNINITYINIKTNNSYIIATNIKINKNNKNTATWPQALRACCSVAAGPVALLLCSSGPLQLCCSKVALLVRSTRCQVPGPLAQVGLPPGTGGATHLVQV